MKKKIEALKENARKEIDKIFKSMACEDPKTAIHETAVAAAVVVALLPIGLDAWALRLCEIKMLMSIYSHYGISISQATAESFLTAAFAQAVGEMAAYGMLEAADTYAIATAGLAAPVTYAICTGVATTLIETVGWTTVKYLEGSKTAEVAVRAMEGIGLATDIGRATGAASGGISTADSSRRNNSNKISFGSNIPKVNDNAQASINKAIGWVNVTNTTGVNHMPEAKASCMQASRIILGPNATSKDVIDLGNQIYQGVATQRK